MKPEIFSILPNNNDLQNEGALKVSFKPFINFIQEKLKTEHSVRAKFYNYTLTHFNEHPQLLENVNAHDLKNFPDSLELIYACLFPLVNSEEETLWALSVPNKDVVFYSTTAFYNNMAASNPGNMYSFATQEEVEAFYKNLEQAKYTLILERIYNIEPFLQDEIVYTWTNSETGLPTYYSIQINNRFVDVVKKANAPGQKDVSLITKQQLKHANSLGYLESAIPLSSYCFEGFSIITATDITPRYALHKMRSTIIRAKHGDYKEVYKTIAFLLKALCGSQFIQFGLLPFLKLNGRLVSMYAAYEQSIIITAAREQKIDEAAFVKWLNEYYQNPVIKLYEDCADADLHDNIPFCDSFTKHGIKTYGILPVYYQNKVVGIIELSAEKKHVLDEKILKRVEAATAILAQLMYDSQAEFTEMIDEIIKFNFTSIQPSVEWKFNEAALEYLEEKFKKKNNETIPAIRFKELYPLYGAIDIRNSTVQRNIALVEDTKVYLTLLNELLDNIHADAPAAVEELRKKSAQIKLKEGSFLDGNGEATVIMLMQDVSGFLRAYRKQHPGKNDGVINKYFEAVKPQGEVYNRRQAFEKSLQKINSIISKYLDDMQAEIQKIYPVYFEKFRTDGIEYDLYIGQSISPEKPYKEEYLNELRLLQLKSMVEITRLVHAKEKSMIIPLQITQLIYVNASAIDISFRTDEKRFDVEGGYNIRYQIVKKRIDKAHILHTEERLTQPDKIAIVYSSMQYQNIYMQYIQQLQQQGLLQPDAEILELEELQGVSGLKAIRVSIVL